MGDRLGASPIRFTKLLESPDAALDILNTGDRQAGRDLPLLVASPHRIAALAKTLGQAGAVSAGG